MTSPVIFIRNRSVFSKQLGATLVESVLILPLLLVLIFAIVELSRFWGVKGVVNQGAQRGLDLAIKIPYLEFEQSSSNANPSCVNDITSCSGYSDYLTSRTEVIDAAGRLPTDALVGAGYTGDTTRFVGFARVRMVRDESIVFETVPAMLLRPGECISDTDGTLHCHPTICPSLEPERADCLAMNPSARAKSATDTMEELLKVEPIAIVMPVKFRAMLPIPSINTFSALGIAGGFREIISTGSYPIPVALPPLPPSPTVTPTATPTDVPGAPTRTPVSTATSVPTATATRTPIPCVTACNHPSVVDSCGRTQDKQCAVCRNGSCVCTNRCSSSG